MSDKFRPSVRAEGLTLVVSACDYASSLASGHMDESRVSFTSADAGKFFYISLVRRKSDGYVFYHLIVQAPEVQTPMVPEENPSIDVLFPFASGQVAADGGSLNYNSRGFGG